MMKNHSSKTHLSIRKPLMTEDINTDSNFHPNLQRLQHNMQALRRRIAVEKSFGTAPTQLVDEEVSKNSPLHKIFNRNHHKPTMAQEGHSPVLVFDSLVMVLHSPVMVLHSPVMVLHSLVLVFTQSSYNFYTVQFYFFTE